MAAYTIAAQLRGLFHRGKQEKCALDVAPPNCKVLNSVHNNHKNQIKNKNNKNVKNQTKCRDFFNSNQ